MTIRFAGPLACAATAAFLSGCMATQDYTYYPQAVRVEPAYPDEAYPGPRVATFPAAPARREYGYPADALSGWAGFDHDRIYAATTDEGIVIPAFAYRGFDRRYLRQQVEYPGPEAPGTIVIDTGSRFLYLVRPGGTAIRYGIAVGREGFGWTGEAVVGRKQEWPTWTPPDSMIERDPKLARYSGGMDGGIENPLGARAIYLFSDGRDTMYRIHGTNEPRTIGTRASSGCFRMINQDVLDLYGRVGTGARVVVRGDPVEPDGWRRL